MNHNVTGPTFMHHNVTSSTFMNHNVTSSIFMNPKGTGARTNCLKTLCLRIINLPNMPNCGSIFTVLLQR